mgnify:CR=1 FL=1
MGCRCIVWKYPLKINMECLKVSFLSNMFGFKLDKESNHSIDFKQINSLVEDFFSGKLTGEALLSFPRETSSIVMLAIRERSLLSISGHIILRKMVYIKRILNSIVIQNMNYYICILVLVWKLKNQFT